MGGRVVGELALVVTPSNDVAADDDMRTANASFLVGVFVPPDPAAVCSLSSACCFGDNEEHCDDCDELMDRW